tara:strand:+ start:974 stop:1201 length:228 start_codon:yes stop_codon:yes gene_type:complete
MSFLMPKVSIPAPPKLEMPDDSKVPNLEDEARRKQEAEDMRRRTSNRKGRRSTILTTPDYEETAATTDKPTLLGG